MYNPSHILAVNKLIILLLIKDMGIPLSNPQIIDFIASNGYSDYFSIQQYLSELNKSKFLDKFENEHITYYQITEDGIRALELFSEQIPQNIKEIIFNYAQKTTKKFECRNNIKAQYFFKSSTNFDVQCAIEKNNVTTIDLHINVDSEQEAQAICTNWQNNFTSIYNSILELLNSKQ